MNARVALFALKKSDREVLRQLGTIARNQLVPHDTTHIPRVEGGKPYLQQLPPSIIRALLESERHNAVIRTIHAHYDQLIVQAFAEPYDPRPGPHSFSSKTAGQRPAVCLLG